MMACLATHDKQGPDKKFLQFFPLIARYSTDERNFVKKAVNWALRGMGKRNKVLRRSAISLAKRLVVSESASARWIGKDALREIE